LDLPCEKKTIKDKLMDKVKQFSFYLNAALIVLAIWLWQCGGKKCPDPKIVKMPVKDTMWQKGKEDSMFKHPVITYKMSDPQFIRGKDNIIEVPGKEKIIYVPRELTNLDSAEAIQNYYDKHIFVDTLRGASCLVALRDSVGMNKILGMTFSIKNNRLTVENNLNPNRTKIFLGGQAGLSLDLKTALLAPSLGLMTKDDHYFQVGYDFFNKMPMGSVMFKIHLGK